MGSDSVRTNEYSDSIKSPMRWLAGLLLPLLMMVCGAAATEVIEPGKSLSTFDPYGDTDVDISSEKEAVAELRPQVMLSLGYTYTYRSGFESELAQSATEQMHMWTVGATYMPFSFLFGGVALPLAVSRFEGTTSRVSPDNTIDSLPEFDWTGGMGDLATYLGSELPWIPLTLTALLMWPTGDIEKGMGTGEYSAGLTADVSWQFGRINTKIGGFYFLLKDPEVTRITEQPDGTIVESQVRQRLPNSYGASLAATMPVATLRLGVGFRWSYRMLITWDTAHVLEPSVKVVWPVTKWFATVLNAGMEVYPTFALTPNLTLVWSI